MEYLTSNGYKPWVVETWVRGTNRTRDLFNMFDIIAVGHGSTLAVQVTSMSNVSARAKKVMSGEVLDDVIESGWIPIVMGVAPNKPPRVVRILSRSKCVKSTLPAASE